MAFDREQTLETIDNLFDEWDTEPTEKTYWEIMRLGHELKQQDQKDPEGYNIHGVINNERDPALAIMNYEFAIVLDPDDPDLYSNMSVAHENLQDDMKSVEYIQKAIDIEPKALYYHDLGAAYIRLEQYEQALDAIDTALQLGEHHIYHLDRGIVLNHLERFEEAASELAPLAREFPSMTEAHMHLYYAKESLGIDAHDDLETALALDKEIIQELLINYQSSDFMRN